MSSNSLFYLVGNPVKHSFSKDYFNDKFKRLGLINYHYDTLELSKIENLTKVLNEDKSIKGLNITSPFKIEIIPLLDKLDKTALQIGAVNCVKIKKDELIGYNTDWIGFKDSLLQQTDITNIHQAIILGSKGAALAVGYALEQLKIKHIFVSRQEKQNSKNIISYKQLNSLNNFDDFDLIINATPCGMLTNTPICDIDTQKIKSKHVVYDLIYNPACTPLLQISKNKGAKIINGLKMLYSQAEYSWKIWQ